MCQATRQHRTREHTRRPWVGIGLALILWTAGFLGAAAAQAPGGGTLTFATENAFAGFDALKARGFAICDAIVNHTICERLFDMDEDGRLIPVLGLSADCSEDGRTWTIQLRQGVVFHDGTPFDADAVLAHWTRLIDPRNRYRERALMAAIEAVEKVDAYTIRFRLAHPWPPFAGMLCNPRTLTAYIPSPKAVDADRQQRAPVGTGPFMFKEWISGERLVVVRNPRYWRADKPRLEAIVFKPVPDEQTRFASLRSGDLDVIWTDRGQLIAQAAGGPALRHYQGEGNGAEIILFNTKAPPFDDVRVRRALAHAWNQPLYVSLNYKGCIPVVAHPLGAGANCPETGYRAFDLEAARQLMAPVESPPEFTFLHSNSQRGREIGEITQQFFKPLGVVVQPQGLSFGAVIKKVVTGDFQASTWRIPPSLDFGPYFYLAFHSKSRSNWARYQDVEMDRLLEDQNRETDPAARARLLCRVVQLINRDVPILYRGGKRFHLLAGKKVKNIDPIRRGIPNLAEAWIEK